jgi:hypothetical protein
MNIGPVMATPALCVLAWGSPPTAWYRWDTTRAQLRVDDARCRLIAEGTNPDFGVVTIKTGSFRRELAADAATGLLHVVGPSSSSGASFPLEPVCRDIRDSQRSKRRRMRLRARAGH